MGEVSELLPQVGEKLAPHDWDDTEETDAEGRLAATLTVSSVITGAGLAEMTVSGSAKFVGRVLEGAADAVQDMNED
jgi:hypothetical protein